MNNEVTRAAHAERYEAYVLEHVDSRRARSIPRRPRQGRAGAFVARHIRVRGRASAGWLASSCREAPRRGAWRTGTRPAIWASPLPCQPPERHGHGAPVPLRHRRPKSASEPCESLCDSRCSPNGSPGAFCVGSQPRVDLGFPDSGGGNGKHLSLNRWIPSVVGSKMPSRQGGPPRDTSAATSQPGVDVRK